MRQGKTVPLMVLIACSASKLSHAAPARDLYTSDLFRKSLAWAESLQDEGGKVIFVLSAMHGLVPLDRVIEPYDVSLVNMTAPQRRVWAQAAWQQLRHHLSEGADIVFLAGRLYRDGLVARMLSNGVAQERIKVPLEGLGIGQQKQWLAQRLLRSSMEAGSVDIRVRTDHFFSTFG